MNTLKLKLFIGALAFALLIPSTTMAYFTTGQTASRLSASTILYTVTYEFGFPSREVYMPIGALRDSSTTSSPYLKYAIVDDKNNPINIGNSAALVFTGDKDVVIKDNQYYLAPGKSAKFTLMAFLTIPVEQRTKPLNMSLLVTSLPFTMIGDGTPIKAHLNPSELQYYRTPAINTLINSITVTGVTFTIVPK